MARHEAVGAKISFIAATTFALEAVVDLSSQMADEDRNDIRIEAALAKLYGSEMGWRMADELVQIRGGRGFETADSLAARGERPVPAEQMLRDMRINRIFEGSTEIMHLLIAREAVDAHLSVAGDLIDPDASLKDKARAGGQATAFYARWLPKLVAGPGQLPGAYAAFHPHGHPDLSVHLRHVERSARKLARSTFYAMSRWQGKMETKQGFLGRIVDIGAELFAMSAACVRAELLRSSDDHGREAYQLADVFCRQARIRVDELFTRLWSNTDDLDRTVVSGSCPVRTPGWNRASSTPPAKAPGSPTRPRDRPRRTTSTAESADPRPGAVHCPDRPGARRARTAECPSVTVIEIPGSKSVTARALFLAAAAEGTTTLLRPLVSDDTEGFAGGLTALGYQVDRGPDAWRVEGRPEGPAVAEAQVYCRDGATTARFLPTLASAGRGVYRFDASPQMRRRPLAPLTRALQELGVDLVHEEAEGTTRCGSTRRASRAGNSPSMRASRPSTSPRC